MTHVSFHNLTDLIRPDGAGGPFSVCRACGDPPTEWGCTTGRCRSTCGDCPPGGCGPHCDPLATAGAS